MVNKYKGSCSYCGGTVPVNGGNLRKVGRKWQVSHLSCEAAKSPQVIVTTFNSGESVWVNSGGRCEDAPCCGCCS